MTDQSKSIIAVMSGWFCDPPEESIHTGEEMGVPGDAVGGIVCKLVERHPPELLSAVPAVAHGFPPGAGGGPVQSATLHAG